MNDTVVWGLIGLGVLLLGWLWWPKKTVTETLEEVKAEEKAAPVNPQITDAVTQTAPAKKTRAKKPAAPKKTAAKKAPAKKAAPKKAVKKGRK
jgi:hypothetical protein